MTYVEYKEELYLLKENLQDSPSELVDGLSSSQRVEKAVLLIEEIEKELFLGQTELQPIKFHQLIRIYKLAKTFIEILVLIWPIIRELLKLFKK